MLIEFVVRSALCVLRLLYARRPPAGEAGTTQDAGRNIFKAYMKRLLTVILLLIYFSQLAIAQDCSDSPLKLTIAPVKSVYKYKEDIKIQVEWKNITDKTLKIKKAGLIIWNFTMKNTRGESID